MSNSLVIVGRFSKCPFTSFYQDAHSLDTCLANGALPKQSPRDRWTSECLKRWLTQLTQQSLTAALLECVLMTFDDPIDPCWSLSQTLGLRLVFQYMSASRADAWLPLALRQAADAQGLGLQLSCIPWSKFRFHRETNHKTYNPLRVMTWLQYSRFALKRVAVNAVHQSRSYKVLQSLTKSYKACGPEMSRNKLLDWIQSDQDSTSLSLPTCPNRWCLEASVAA